MKSDTCRSTECISLWLTGGKHNFDHVGIFCDEQHKFETLTQRSGNLEMQKMLISNNLDHAAGVDSPC